MYKNIFSCSVLLLTFLVSYGLMAQQTAYGCQRIVSRDDLVRIGEGYFYRNALPHRTKGFGCTYYESGRLIWEVPLKNNKNDGIAKTYFESGKLMRETPYRDDKREGIARDYFESGKLQQETPYRNGNREGITKSYFESGRLSQETPYRNGIREGQMKRYRENGKLFFTMMFKDNSPVSGVCHHTNGTTAPLTNQCN